MPDSLSRRDADIIEARDPRPDPYPRTPNPRAEYITAHAKLLGAQVLSITENGDVKIAVYLNEAMLQSTWNFEEQFVPDISSTDFLAGITPRLNAAIEYLVGALRSVENGKHNGEDEEPGSDEPEEVYLDDEA